MTMLVFLVMICLLVLSAPIAVALGVAVVFPSVIDPNFLTSQAYIVRSIFSGVDSTPLLGNSIVRILRRCHGTGRHLEEIVRRYGISGGKYDRRYAVRGHPDLSVLRRDLRFRTSYMCGCRRNGDSGTA